MKKQIIKSMVILPLAFSMMIPTTLSIAAEEAQEPQTQEQTTNLVQEEATTTETIEENYQYVATFYDEDGTLLDSISKESSDSSIIINPTKIPTKEGYTFIGWTKTQGSSTIDFNKEEVTLDQTNPEVKFYAVYQENPKEETKEDAKEAEQEMKSYMVHFLDENGNELEAVTKESEDSSIVITPTITPSKENYTFIGWASEQHSSKADLGKDGITVDASNPELSVYAVYSLNFKATVRFCDEDGKEIETKTVMRDDIHTDKVTTRKVRPSQTPSKEGYEFLGWSTTKGSKTAEFDQGYVEVSQDNPKVTVYAVYKDTAFKFTVHFCDEDGTEIETVSHKDIVDNNYLKDHKEIKFGSFTIPLNPEDIDFPGIGYEIIYPNKIPTKEGYELAGWSKEKGSQTIDYTNKEGVKVFRRDPEVTVYAVYKEKLTKYTVHFCDEDGKLIETVSEEETQRAWDIKRGNVSVSPFDGFLIPSWKQHMINNLSKMDIKPSKIPSKKGYVFLGWAKEKGSKTADYGRKDAITVTDKNPEVSVYAVYKNDEKKTYTISYYNNTQVYQSYFTRKNANKIYSEYLPKMSYTKEVNESKLVDGYNVKLSKVVLKQRTYFVNSLRDEFNRKEFTYTKNRGNLSKLFAPKRIDFVFCGWTTDPNGTEPEYRPSDKIKITENNTDIKLYAVFKPRPRNLAKEALTKNVDESVKVIFSILEIIIRIL